MYVNFTVTYEYTYETDNRAELAKVLGVAPRELKLIIAGDLEYAPDSTEAQKRLIDNATLDAEDFEIQELGD